LVRGVTCGRVQLYCIFNVHVHVVMLLCCYVVVLLCCYVIMVSWCLFEFKGCFQSKQRYEQGYAISQWATTHHSK
jgi:hypothetical protein